MKARRLELGMRTWRDLAERAGFSYETLRAVRAGSNPSDATADSLEKALRWAPGSIEQIQAGGDPVERRRRSEELLEARETSTAENADHWREIEELREYNDRVEAAARNAGQRRAVLEVLRIVQDPDESRGA